MTQFPWRLWIVITDKERGNISFGYTHVHTQDTEEYLTARCFRHWNFYLPPTSHHPLAYFSATTKHDSIKDGSALVKMITPLARDTKSALSGGISFHSLCYFCIVILLFHLFILYHNKGEMACDIEDVIWPSRNRAPEIAEHEDDYPVGWDTQAGLGITSNHSIHKLNLLLPS